VDEVEDPPKGNPSPAGTCPRAGWAHAMYSASAVSWAHAEQGHGPLRCRPLQPATRAPGRPARRRQAPSVCPTHGARRTRLPTTPKTADRCLTAKAAMFEALGVAVHLRGYMHLIPVQCQGGAALRQVLALAFPPQTGLITPKADVAPHWRVSIPTATRHTKESS